MSEITRGVMGMPYEMAMESELSRRQFYSIAKEVYADRDALKAECEGLRKDAERYRWLRDGAGYCDTRDIPGMAPARMDAFIDAGIQQGGQSNG